MNAPAGFRSPAACISRGSRRWFRRFGATKFCRADRGPELRVRPVRRGQGLGNFRPAAWEIDPTKTFRADPRADSPPRSPARLLLPYPPVTFEVNRFKVCELRGFPANKATAGSGNPRLGGSTSPGWDCRAGRTRRPASRRDTRWRGPGESRAVAPPPGPHLPRRRLSRGTVDGVAHRALQLELRGIEVGHGAHVFTTHGRQSLERLQRLQR